MVLQDFASWNGIAGAVPGEVVRGPWPLGAPAERHDIAVDLFVRRDAVVIKALLPGVRADQIGLLIGDAWLDITVDALIEAGAPEENYILRELPRGTLARTIPLPEGTEPSQLEVCLENGVLTITIPWEEPIEGVRP